MSTERKTIKLMFAQAFLRGEKVPLVVIAAEDEDGFRQAVILENITSPKMILHAVTKLMTAFMDRVGLVGPDEQLTGHELNGAEFAGRYDSVILMAADTSHADYIEPAKVPPQ